MKILKSQLKRIIKEEISRVRVEKLVSFILRNTPASYLPDRLRAALREELTDFLYNNKDLVEELMDMMLDESLEEFVDFAMERVVGPLIDQLDAPEESRDRTYKILKDDGRALYFENAFKRELKYVGPGGFVSEINNILKGMRISWAGFKYEERSVMRPDGSSTSGGGRPIFEYKGVRELVIMMKETALKHGISLMMPQ